MTKEGAAFGPALRRARNESGLTLRDMADRCGTNHTHLSRLENSRGRVPSRELLDRILGAIADPGVSAQVAAAAGRLTPGVEAVLSRLSRALSEPMLSGRALPVLRRLEAAAAADAFLERLSGRAVTGIRVDPEVLCRAQGLRPVIRAGTAGPAASFEDDGVVVIRDPGEPGDAGALPRIRFLLAHAAAHAFRGESACTFPFIKPGEVPALDMAANLLCPLPLLRRAVAAISLDLEEDARNLWSSQSASVVPAVAERLAVPGWVALRRLADESLLDDEALYYTLGDQP